MSTRRIPDQLPELTLPDIHGRSHPLSEFRGHPLLVNFWATWCEPCRREIPLLDRLQAEYGKDGVEIVGIAIDNAVNVEKYVSKQHVGYPVRVAERQGLEAVEAFGMDTVLPFTVFADRAGQILTLKVGELRPQEAQLILQRLLSVDQGQMTLQQARTELTAAMARLSAERAASEGAGKPADSR